MVLNKTEQDAFFVLCHVMVYKSVAVRLSFHPSSHSTGWKGNCPALDNMSLYLDHLS